MFADNINTIIPVISTLAGIVIGWLLNELRDYFKLRRENKRVINHVLFNLLEIRSILAKTEMEHSSEFIIKLIEDKYPQVPKKQMRFYMRSIFNLYLKKIVADNQNNSIQSIENRYKDSVDDFSKIFPLLAYEVGGKINLYNYLTFLTKYVEKIDDMVRAEFNNDLVPNDQDEYHSFTELISEFFETNLFKKALNSISVDIIKISKKLGRSTKKSCEEIMHGQDSSFESEDFQIFFDDYMEKVSSYQ
ncbi:hypothetical protein MATR_26870 [Marivirga tractuosa]|uniref:Uncharacterized protein n=1 Tax=Marivirga tractuosa (strain ATCC 23168 / DSM 4126 / NBRC 15989 / NCIMB 1408 / VKM B-1430 / H-43) TaxID=643867 RepID=E4TN73_MARTH|nr:hypothetical protein [Marivirga tractuosa]ADR23461.1 hypothetical protein Ftrac_3489 [Marivirga tractuosa DSM 4126]BDD15862.1 hypothetical protein MATR_26870 [Marivirga tractuosa]